MKNYQLLLSILIFTISSFLTKISAQELIREGVQWNVHAVYWSFPPFEETVSLKVEGDTLINNVLYKKIHESYDSLYLIWAQRDDYIREDSNKKVYLLNDTEEHLLYDFNLVVGDTFHITYDHVWEECNFLVVTQLDTIQLINGDSRKRWKLENTDPEVFGFITYWTEGIGSHAGLVRFITEQYGCWEHYPYSLICYSSDGEEIYNNDSEEADCWRTLVSTRELTLEDGISVYPNPVRENVVVQSKDANRNIIQMELYSSTGQLLNKVRVNAEKATVNMNTYPKGPYFLLIEDANGMKRSVKLIKVE